MSSFVLKCVALITMMIDHTGAVFPSYFPYMFRCIGRMSFPIYVFLIAEGCRHSRDVWRYMLPRLGVFALISQIPFCLCFNHTRTGIYVSFVNDTNIFYTLFLGVLAVAEYRVIIDWIKARELDLTKVSNNKILQRVYFVARHLPALVPAIGCMYLAEYLSTDYGSFGVAWIVAMYLCRNKPLQVACAAIGVVYKYGSGIVSLFVDSLTNMNFLPMINRFELMQYDYIKLGLTFVSVALLALYNGKRGRSFKLMFYSAYPVHLAVLGIIWWIIK